MKETIKFKDLEKIIKESKEECVRFGGQIHNKLYRNGYINAISQFNNYLKIKLEEYKK